MKTVRLGLMFWAVAALAQFPFPGQYPGGGYPGGNPNPGGRRNPQQQQQQQNSRRPRAVSASTDGMLRRVSGNQIVIEPDDHRIVWFRITAQTVVRKDGDRGDLSKFQPGDRVSIDSTEDDEGNLTAAEINWDRDGSVSERAYAQQTWDLPGTNTQASSGAPPSSNRSTGYVDDDDRPILRRKSDDSAASPSAQTPPASPPPAPARNTPPAAANAPAADDDSTPNRPTTQYQPGATPPDADDPGRPVLRRGGAATARQQPSSSPGAPPPANPATSASPAPKSAPAGNGPGLVGVNSDSQAGRPRAQAAAVQEDPLIEKVREAAYTYSSTLPNFFCQQMTTRYRTQNVRQGWETIDLVTADLAYENGQESYRNIKVGSRTAKNMDEVGGTRSSGEFSSVLQDLMSEATGATFRRTGTDTIHGRSAIVFSLDVARERSHWHVEAPSQLYYPAYKGSIWVDRETSRVLRIELQARGLPSQFPFDTVESATDYDFIRLAAGEREYLLPANAEVLSCERGSSNCSRNRIEFRNYRKFDAASSISFDTK